MSVVRTVLVCEAQVPFVYGGAERHVRGLVRELAAPRLSCEKSLDSVQALPEERAARTGGAVEARRSVRSELRDRRSRHRHEIPDLLRPPSEQGDLAVSSVPRDLRSLRHDRTASSVNSEADVRLRDRLIGLDTEALAESKRLFSNARNTATRLAKYNGLVAEPLYHPPPLAGGARGRRAFGDYVLSVGRLELNKRVELIVNALALTDRAVRLVIAGHGADRRRLDDIVGDARRWQSRSRSPATSTIGSPGRAVRQRAGRHLSANRRGLRLRDARGISGAKADRHDFRRWRTARVRRGRRQRHRGPHRLAEAIAAAIARLAADRALARRLGEAGFERARLITWIGRRRAARSANTVDLVICDLVIGDCCGIGRLND